jgi:hypothetical protein
MIVVLTVSAPTIHLFELITALYFVLALIHVFLANAR